MKADKRNFTKVERLEKLQLVAENMGGTLLSKQYVNANTKLRWRCKLGQIWEATPSRILMGRWCHACVGTKKKTIDDCYTLAKEWGGRCLSDIYASNSKPLT